MSSLAQQGDSFGSVDVDRAAATMASRRFRGLLWREHLAHGRLVYGYVGTWILCQWVLLLFGNPAPIFLFGGLCALYFASAFACSDARDGAQEFVLALPSTRGELFRVRLLYSGGVLLTLLVGSALAIRFELAQKLWSLFVETGFTESYAPIDTVWIIAGVVVPFAAFAFTFAFGAIATDARSASSSSTVGFLFTGLVVMAGLVLEYFALGRQTGYLALAAAFVCSLACLFLGYRAFLVKDGIDRPASRVHGGSSGSNGSGFVAALVIIGVLGLLAVLAFYLLTARPVEP